MWMAPCGRGVLVSAPTLRHRTGVTKALEETQAPAHRGLGALDRSGMPRRQGAEGGGGSILRVCLIRARPLWQCH